MYLAGLHVTCNYENVYESGYRNNIIPLIIWLLYLDILCLNRGLHSWFNECLGGSSAYPQLVKHFN